MPDIVIVGGGVIGCATAYYLTEQGASVTLVERGELAGEASGAAAGMLAALSGEGDRGSGFETLCLESRTLYDTLLPSLASTGVDVELHRCGVLNAALTDADAAALRHSFDPKSARWLEGAALFEAEPGLNRRAVAGHLQPDQLYLDPAQLTRALAAAARQRGATIVTQAPVHRFRRAGKRVVAVEAGDASYSADAILLAAGPWTQALAARLGAHVPVRPVRGQMLSLEGPSTPLRNMVWGRHAYLLARAGGQTYVGSTVEEVGYRKHNTAAATAAMRRGARELIPELGTAPLRRSWSGLRPGTPDELPVMGRLTGWDNAWVASGHFRNGILMAPRSGQLMASSLLNDAPDASLKPFDPARFLD